MQAQDQHEAAAASAPLRPRHVLSAYASAGWAGAMAASAWIFALAIAWPLVARPLVDLSEAPGTLILLSILAGVMYVELIFWLPRSLARRSIIFSFVMMATFGGIAAAALPAAAREGILVLSWAIGLSVPVALRGTLLLFVRSIASVLVLPLGQSMPILLLIIPVYAWAGADQLGAIVGAAPVATGLVVVTIVALGLAAWTVGLRPAEARPRWYGAYGVVACAVAMASGLGSALR